MTMNWQALSLREAVIHSFIYILLFNYYSFIYYLPLPPGLDPITSAGAEVRGGGERVAVSVGSFFRFIIIAG